MLFDLFNFDYSQVDLRSAPKTKGLLDQIVKTISSPKRFWFEILRQGYINEAEQWPVYIRVQDLYDSYIEFAKKINIRHPATDSEFGKELRKVCKKISRKQKVLEGGNRRWVFFLPHLEECRKLFEDSTGKKLQWDED
jgi:hypothetical protein